MEDLGGALMAVDEDAHPGGAASAGVGDGDMPPVTRVQAGLLRARDQGVGRVAFAEPKLDLAIDQADLAAAAEGRVVLGAAVVHRRQQWYVAGVVGVGADPERHAQALFAGEVEGLGRHGGNGVERDVRRGAPGGSGDAWRAGRSAGGEQVGAEVADGGSGLGEQGAQGAIGCGGAGRERGAGAADGGLELGEAALLVGEGDLLGGGRCRDHWHGVGDAAILAELGHIVEEGEEAEVVALRDRVELVIVAAGALEGQTQPGGAERADPVGDVFDAVSPSSMMPPSELITWLRPKPVAMRCSRVGEGRRSPASCSVTNVLYGRLRLKASITQSRQRHIVRVESLLKPWESA